MMFFDWKIQLEKVQLTRDLKDDTILYQEIRLPCKNYQGYCENTTRTQAIVMMQDIYYQVYYQGNIIFLINRSNSLNYEGNILWFYTCTKKITFICF